MKLLSLKTKQEEKSPFMTYADFESILVSENNGRQNTDASHKNNFQNHVGCSFGYKLLCVDDQFSRPYRSYLGQNTAHKFITNMVKESKYCSRMMKKVF